MDRASRRREIKQITKELAYIEKHTQFKKLYSDRELAELDESALDLLDKKLHPDQRLQGRYDAFHTLFQRIITLEARLQYLRVGYKSEKNIPHVQ
jgi:hypothetical protein